MRKFLSLLLFPSFFSLPLLAQHDTTWGDIDYQGRPWVNNVSRPYSISKGLEGRHLALWASHGRFYDLEKGRWRWQRPSLFTTCEDLFTQTIVVPFLIPMLENAGAVVFTPRERDWQRHEVIVDNDDQPSIHYEERVRNIEWDYAYQNGFAQHKGVYRDGENPFDAGTARMAETTRSKSKYSSIVFRPSIPETGKYAVYVSYQTLPSSIDDAHYIVWHQGQKTEFRVNQQMGGSTWVYLGSFLFDAGCDDMNCVVLTNQSNDGGHVTSDAVRFGGGMGNIERGGTVSHMPRCLEGARYYAQWAGMPYNIYSSKNGMNDYGDDINVRSLMLNELCGGSVYYPDSAGRNVPIELSLAVHSDAGYNKPDGEGVFGTLTICTTGNGNPTLGAGTPREMSRELAASLLDNTTADLQHMYKTWTPREVRDRNYSETRLPVVPSAILETLSHQNFTDIRYGLDPTFKFTLARSVYKTLLRYVCKNHDEDYVVTPLTPKHFRVEFTGKSKGEALISWEANIDPQEPTSDPTSYILYTAEGDGDFDNGTIVKGTSKTMRLDSGKLYSFRVEALNKGGKSFPTQVLSACYHSKRRKTVLIVDGFERLASPAVVGSGFDIDEDPGVSYGRSCSIIGRQMVYDRNLIGVEDSTGLGYSSHELQGRFIGGNDFNYVRTHARAIHEVSDYNIVSCSKEVVPILPLYNYDMIDLVLGLERNDGYSLMFYKTFPPYLRQVIAQYLVQGGRLFVSGAYVGTDMRAEDDLRFLNQILKCQLIDTYRSPEETIKGMGTSMDIYHQLNEHHYAATSCDVLMPTTNQAFCAMLYPNGMSAAVAYKGYDYRTFVMGFPLECIKDSDSRAFVMKGVLGFLLH